MALFGGSSSKSSTTQSQVGSQTQVGNPIAVNVSGGKYTNASIVLTDYGSVGNAIALAGKVVDSHKEVLDVAQSFATDTLEAAQKVSSEIIAAGQYQAGSVERIAGAFESFVDEQNNPNEKNQMWLIFGAAAVLALVVVKR